MVAASDDINGNCERHLATTAHILDHINFDQLSPEEVKKHACALADRYKLLLEECDNENATVKELRRKLKTLESEKVNFSSKYTDEICELLSENTVLKSKLERLEADKQQTEFTSISKVQTVSTELQEKNNELAATLKTLEDIKGELSTAMISRKEIEDQLKMTKNEFSQKEEVLKNKIDCLASENHTLSTERGALRHKVTDQNNLIKSLEVKIGDLSKDLIVMKKNWEKTQDELDSYTLCSEEKLSQVVGRAEALENKLKSEIAEKHRMTEKTEKITTQLTDLIKTYESCKHETNQMRKELEQSNNENVALQSELQSSKFEVDEMRAQLEEYNQNFLSINSELNQAIIRQREFEQTYGDPMKDLEAVLLQHAQIDSSRNTAAGKGGQSVQGVGSNQAGGRRTQERALARSSSKRKKNDVGVLVPTKDSSSSAMPEDFASTVSGNNLESVSPAELVQGIASLMKQYSAQVEAGRAENGALLDRLKAVNVEVNSYKEALEHNKQVLDEVKEQLASKSHEIQKMKREKCEMEQKIDAAHEDGKQLADFGEKQKTRANRLADQITLFRKKAKLDDETKKKQVLLVFNKIVAARRISTGKNNQDANPETNANLSEISEWELIFSNLVENLELFLNSYKQCLEKARDLEFNCLRKDEAMDEMSSKHESEVNSLKAKFSHQYQSISSEALRNEQHYQGVIEELQQKLKDAQSWAEDNSEKIEMLQNLRTSQEIEIGELKQLLLKSQNNAQSFHLALCLLCGVLWPAFGRLNAIICQQRMLITSYEHGQNVCKQIGKLAAAVNGERDDWETEGPNRGLLQHQLVAKLHPLLRFRRGVICVLAANRLIKLSNQSSLCFTVHDLVGGPNCRLSVSMGHTNGGAAKDNVNHRDVFADEFVESNNNVRKTKKKGQSKRLNSGEAVVQLRNQKEKIQEQQVAMLNWLLDSGFSYKVTTSLADLLSFVQNNTVDAEGNQKQLKGILTQSRNSFIQLISRLSQHFENTSASIGAETSSPYERPSLAQSLLKGLHAAMVRLPAEKRAVYVPVQHNLAAVQNALIDLSEKVSTYEEEKAVLNQELLKLRSENSHLLTVKDRAAILQEQLDTLKKQSDSMVSRDKYNKVCTELDGALLREKQAEDLMREQGEQLLSLGKQLEAKHRDESSRELSLAESARELCETKLELSKKTHEMRGLCRKLEELQIEKSKLQQSATHADISARCAVRDGDLVCCYVKTVNNAVENFKNQLIYSPSTVNSLMLPQLEEVVSGNMKLSEELKCCHELVSNFGETLAHLTTQMHNQTNQIRSQRNNIAALKQELLASTKPQILVGNDYSVANGNKNIQPSRSAVGLSSTPDSDYGGSSSATMFGVDPLQSYSSQLSSILRQPRTSSSEHHQELPNNRSESRNSTQSIAKGGTDLATSKMPYKLGKAKGNAENKLGLNSAPTKSTSSRRR